MPICDAFKLSIINRILFKHVAKYTFEALPNPRLIIVYLLMIVPVLPSSGSLSVTRSRSITACATGHRSWQSFGDRTSWW
jgi:hypothetical protein